MDTLTKKKIKIEDGTLTFLDIIQSLLLYYYILLKNIYNRRKDYKNIKVNNKYLLSIKILQIERLIYKNKIYSSYVRYG